MIIRTRALFLMGLIVAVSCSDSGNPLTPGGGEPPPPPPPASLVALDCTVSVTGGGMQCALPQPGTGAASGSGELIVGGQNVYVSLAASNFSTPADTIQFDVTVKNLIPQALGTTDGVSVHPDGVRVFFYDGPVSNNPSAAASVANPDGFGFFTAASQPYFQWNEKLAPNQTSAPRTWKIQYTPGSTSVSFRVYVWAQVQYENGWVDVTPPADTLPQGGTTILGATARDRIGRTGTVSQTFTWSRGGDGVTTVDASTGEVTALAASGIDTIYVTNGTQTGRAIIIVENAPAFQQDTIAAISNVTVGRPAPRLASRISDTESNANVVPGTYTSVAGGTARVYANGSYDYLSPAGFSGADSFEFDISDGVHTIKGSVIVNVASSKYWYVQAGGTGDGRDRFPFGSIAAAQDSAVAGDSIFVLSAGATALDGAAVLEDAQALIGQGIPASITLSLNDTTITLLAAGSAPGLSRTDAGPAVTLGLGNTIRGLGITAAAGAGITGNAFGTLTTSHLGVSATGPALHLTTGTLAANFEVLTSTNSGTEGLFLSGVGGALTATGGAISGATGPAIDIVGGDGTITYPGNVTNSAGRSVSVTGRSGGAVTLSGNITDTGTGILATGNTAGTLAFTGTSKSLSTGANTAVTLSGNTGSTVSFENGGLRIATTTGTGFSATTGGTIAVFNGASNDDIAVSGAGAHALVLNGVTASASGIAFDTVNASGTTTGAALHVDAVDGTGTVAITSAEVAGTAALQPGIRVADNAAPVTIASATVDGTGGAGILVSFNTGAVTVSGGTIGGTTPPTGAGIQIAGGTGDVTIASSVTQTSAARVADVQDRSAGTVTLTGTMSCTTACTGILAQNNSGGVINFNATSKVLTTGANQAVTLATNSGATLGFGGGGLAITTTTGTGFGASGGGTVTVTGANNAVVSGTGTAVSIAATTIGGTGAVFRSVSASGGANGIVLNGTGAGTFGVTGDGATAGSGGTIAPAAAGSGVSLTSVAGTTLDYLTISGAGTGILGSGFGTLSVTGTSVTSTGAPALNLTTGTVNGTFPNVSASGSSGHGVALDGVGGTWTVAAGTVSGSANGAALHLAGNQAGGTLTWQAALAQANGHPVLSVSTHSNGTLNVTGTVSGTGTSTGLRFSDADGTYNLSPSAATTLSGTGGAVSILAGSAGTFAFSGNLSAASTSGAVAPFALNGSSPNVTFNGNLTTGGTATGRLVDVTSQFGGAITFQSGTLSATSGTGILLNNADGSVNFNGTTTLNGGDAAVDVENTSSGTISFAAGASVTNPINELIRITSSAPTFTYSGAFTKNNNSVTAILAQSNTGGTLTFNGSGVTRSLSTGTANAISLVSNGSMASTFSGGGLAITTTTGHGLYATGSGTLQVTGATNTISSSGGTPLLVSDVTIGASGLSFQSISANGGANGIFLKNTGAQGLQVTGSSSGNCGGDANPNPTGAAPYGARTLPVAGDCTGGTIQTMSGGDGTTAGIGVYLENTANVSLTRMRLTGTHQNYGLRGVGASNLTLDNVLMDGSFGTNVSNDEGTVAFTNLSGSASVVNSFFAGSVEHDFQVRNTSAVTLNRITVDNVVFGTSTASGDHLLLTNDVAGTLNATVRNSRFMGAASDMLQVVAQNGGASDLIVQNNVFFNEHASISSGGGGVNFGIGSTEFDAASLTYLVTGNRFRGASGVAFGVQKGIGTGAATGTVTNNLIGDAAVANSGSQVGNGLYFNVAGRGKHKVLIDGNSVTQYNGYSGMWVLAGGHATGTRNGAMHATIRRNSFTNAGNNGTNYVDALQFDGGTNTGDAYTVCLDVGQGAGNANTLTGLRNATDGSGIAGEEYSVIANNVGVTPGDLWWKLLGYPVATHTPTNATEVDNVLGAANGGVSGWIDAANSSSTYSGNGGAGVACDLP